MSDKGDLHNVENEPHLRAGYFPPDLSEFQSERLGRTVDQIERVEHTVWDEPTVLPELARNVEPDITYGQWLSRNIAQTGWFDSWLVTLLVVCAAGPWGVIGAFAGANAAGFALLAVCVFGPVVEEVSKVAAAMWVVEKRPYCFISAEQILFCAACGGLAFAAIENLIYMHVYVPHHATEFVFFRWTVCLGLHVTCSTLAGLGLVRVWQQSITKLQKPRLELAYGWMVSAMILHGVYNFTVTIAQLTKWLELGMPESSP